MPGRGELVLVLNAGSSTLKYRLVDPGSGEEPFGGTVERIGGREVPDHRAALEVMRRELAEAPTTAGSLLAVGHRVVHGGQHLVDPVVVDDGVLDRVEAAAAYAPLHNPAAAAGIRSAREAYPGVPQVAVFDTGFFRALPPAASTYAIDAGVAEATGIRRYGAHGISHQYVSVAAADHLGRDLGDLRQVVLHLGNGASASAVLGGRPVDTSMGLTPLAGLVMGTRPGDIDPGVLLHLLRNQVVDLDGLDDLLQHRSGLQGLAGVSDFRALRSRMEEGDPRAQAAYDVYCHRLRSYVGAYLAVLGGADVISFTAGIGEHDPGLREDALAGLEELGVVVDPDRNRVPGDGVRRIGADGSRVEVLVVPTREELAIAREAAALLARSAPGHPA